MTHAQQFRMVPVGQAGQGLVTDIQVGAGGESCGAGGIEAGEGFKDVGAGGQADLETLAGLFELAFEGSLFSPGGGQVVRGPQDVEVGLGHVQDQLLLDGGELDPCLFRLGFGRLVVEPAVSAKQGLGQAGLVIVRRIVIGADPADIHIFLGHPSTQADAGQQQRPRLGQHFLSGQSVGFGGGQISAVEQGFLINGHQVGLGQS